MTLTFQSKTVHVFFVLFCIKFQVVPITKFMTVRLTTSPRRSTVAIMNVLITSQSLSQKWRRINLYCRKGSWKPNDNGQKKKGKRTSKDLQNPTLKQNTGGELWCCSTLLVASVMLLWLQTDNKSWMRNKSDCDDKKQNISLVICDKYIRIIGSQPFRKWWLFLLMAFTELLLMPWADKRVPYLLFLQ